LSDSLYHMDYFIYLFVLKKYYSLSLLDTCNIPDDFKHCWLILQTNTSLFNVLCPHSHTYWKTSC